LARQAGCARRSSWSTTANAVATTSADDELMPEASGRFESNVMRAGVRSPKFSVNRSRAAWT
jgi:hypothetical protein